MWIMHIERWCMINSSWHAVLDLSKVTRKIHMYMEFVWVKFVHHASSANLGERCDPS